MNLDAQNEVRRPAVAAMAKKLAKQHPNWTENQCQAEAKARYLAQRNLQGAKP